MFRVERCGLRDSGSKGVAAATARDGVDGQLEALETSQHGVHLDFCFVLSTLQMYAHGFEAVLESEGKTRQVDDGAAYCRRLVSLTNHLRLDVLDPGSQAGSGLLRCLRFSSVLLPVAFRASPTEKGQGVALQHLSHQYSKPDSHKS